MKKIIILGVMLLAAVTFNAKAQGSKGSSAPANGRASLSQTSSPAVANSNSVTMTVDGSTPGNATNDGASGQSGSPSGREVAPTNQKSSKNKANSNRKASRSTVKQRTTSSR